MSKKITLPISKKEVEVRPIKVFQMLDIVKKNDDMQRSISMVSVSTGLTEADICELDFRDFDCLQEELKSFLGRA